MTNLGIKDCGLRSEIVFMTVSGLSVYRSLSQGRVFRTPATPDVFD